VNPPGVVVAVGRWNVVGVGLLNGSNVAFPGVVVAVGHWNVVGVGLLNGSNVAFPRGEKEKISSNPRYCTLESERNVNTATLATTSTL